MWVTTNHDRDTRRSEERQTLGIHKSLFSRVASNLLHYSKYITGVVHELTSMEEFPNTCSNNQPNAFKSFKDQMYPNVTFPAV